MRSDRIWSLSQPSCVIRLQGRWGWSCGWLSRMFLAVEVHSPNAEVGPSTRLPGLPARCVAALSGVAGVAARAAARVAVRTGVPLQLTLPPVIIPMLLPGRRDIPGETILRVPVGGFESLAQDPSTAVLV